MRTREHTGEAAALIVGHWHAGTQMDALPKALRPTTRAEGYAIQAYLEGRSERPLFGWKIAATSECGGVDGPLAGRFLGERVLVSDEVPSLKGNHMAVAEPEFAFRMGRTLGGASYFNLAQTTEFTPQYAILAPVCTHVNMRKMMYFTFSL